MIERVIDYMQYSLNYNESYCIEQEHKRVSGHGFYNRGYIDPLGVARYFGNPNSKKAFVIMSGRACHNYIAVGRELPDIIEQVLSSGGKFSRVDIAITEFCEDDLFTLDDIEKSYELETIVSSWAKYGAKKIVAIDEKYDNPSETIYIGRMDKRGDNGIFRGYDKGWEMGLDRLIATRIEIEDRKDKAHVTAKRIARGDSLSGVFRTRFDCSDDWFNRICEADCVDISRGAQIIESDDRAKNDQRWIWLLNQVAPSLRKAIADEAKFGNGTDRINQFLLASGLAE